MCRVFDSAAFLLSCVVIFVGQLKHVDADGGTLAYHHGLLSVVCRIERKYLCFGDFLPMWTL